MPLPHLRSESVALGDGCYRSRIRLRGAASAAPEQGQGTVVSDGDLVTARYRYLSADTDLEGHYMRSPSADVLAAAAPMWRGLMVRADHSQSVTALAGQTLGDAEYVPGEPGGVEGTIELDRQLSSVVARGVERGILRAVSSVIDLTWRPSHEDLSEDAFWSALGQERDGRVVTRVMASVDRVLGVDIVDFGADPHAQQLASRGPAPQEDRMRDYLVERLGLSADATDDAVREALADRLAARADVDAARADLAAKIAEVERASALAEALQAEIASLRSRVPHPVDVALSEGRISAAQVVGLRKMHAAAPRACEEYLAGLPAGGAVPLGRLTAPAAEAPAYTPEQLAASKKHDVPVEKIAARMRSGL